MFKSQIQHVIGTLISSATILVLTSALKRPSKKASLMLKKLAGSGAVFRGANNFLSLVASVSDHSSEKISKNKFLIDLLILLPGLQCNYKRYFVMLENLAFTLDTSFNNVLI